MPRRGENIYKRKDGSWEGRYAKAHLNGKIQYGYVYAKTYKEVKRKLSEVLVSSQAITETMSNSNFESVALEWISNMRPQLKESSAVKYTNIINLHILPNFGKNHQLTRLILFSHKVSNIKICATLIKKKAIAINE